MNELYHIIGQATEKGNKISDDDSNTISEPRRMMKECSENLDDCQNQLKKLAVLPDEGKFGKAWKSVKLIIQKDDFRRMQRDVHHYVTVFAVPLDLIKEWVICLTSWFIFHSQIPVGEWTKTT